MCISVYRERRIRKCCPTPRQPVRLVVGVDFSRQELLMAPNRRVAHHNQAATGGICTVAPQWGTARPLASMATSKAAAGPAALGTREVRPVAMCDRRWVRTLPVLRSGVSAANTPGRWAYSPSRRLTVPGDQTVNRRRGGHHRVGRPNTSERRCRWRPDRTHSAAFPRLRCTVSADPPKQ